MIKKTVIALSLLTAPIIASAAGGISTTELSRILAFYRTSAPAWRALGAVPDYTGVAISKPQFPSYTSWLQILSATNFLDGIGATISEATAAQAIFYYAITTTAASSANGPTITYSGPGTGGICGLYTDSGTLIPPRTAPAASYASIKLPIITNGAAQTYSSNAIFATTGKPPANQNFNILCFTYSNTSGTIAPIAASPTDFTFTW